MGVRTAVAGRKAALGLISMLLLLAGCASVYRPIMQPAQQRAPLSILSSAVVEPNALESAGIDFALEPLSTKGVYFFGMFPGAQVFASNLSGNVLSTMKMLNPNLKSEVLWSPLDSLRNPDLIAFAKRTQHLDFDSYLKDKPASSFSVAAFKWLSLPSLPTRKIQPGETWDEVTKLRTKKGGILIFDEGRVDTEFIASFQHFTFVGIAEAQGKRFALIEVDQSLLYVDMYADESIGSSMYANAGKLSLAYDYQTRQIAEATVSGRFNLYSGGALGLPLHPFSETDASDKVRDALKTVKAGNAVVGLSNAGGGGLWGVGGAILQTVGIEKSRSLASLIGDEIFMKLTNEEIPPLVEAYLGSAVYPIQYPEALEYRIDYVDSDPARAALVSGPLQPAFFPELRVYTGTVKILEGPGSPVEHWVKLTLGADGTATFSKDGPMEGTYTLNKDAVTIKVTGTTEKKALQHTVEILGKLEGSTFSATFVDDFGAVGAQSGMLRLERLAGELKVRSYSESYTDPSTIQPSAVMNSLLDVSLVGSALQVRVTDDLGYLDLGPTTPGLVTIQPRYFAESNARSITLTEGGTVTLDVPIPLVTLTYLVLNPERAPTDSLQLRKALASSLDRGRLVEKLGGVLRPSRNLIPTSMAGSWSSNALSVVESSPAQDLATGNAVSTIEILTNTGKAKVQVAEFLAESWLSLKGLPKIQVTALPYAELVSRKEETRDFQVATAGYVLDGNNLLGLFDTIGRSIRTPTFTGLLAAGHKAFTARKFAEFESKLVEMNNYLIDNALVIPLYE